MKKKNDILEVKHLSKYFQVSKGLFRKHSYIKAVDDVSFELYAGETYGLVGESGSGKSTIGRAVIRLYNPTAGKIIFDGKDISKKMTRTDEKFLRTNMQMIFQDSTSTLDPRMSVKEIIANLRYQMKLLMIWKN